MAQVTTLSLLAALAAFDARAQAEFRDDEFLGHGRPEAWALHRANAATLFSPGGTPLAGWSASLDLGHVPDLPEARQRVGFRGTKAEDLDRSPVFARLRVGAVFAGLWFAEGGYTPPLTVDGMRAEELVAIAFGRHLPLHGGLRLTARVFAQHGWIEGDITCPGRLAGNNDPDVNPYGCEAASRDRIALAYHGLDLTLARQLASWRWQASLGAVRSEPEVRVDALTFGVRDRSRLAARRTLPFAVVGIGRPLGRRWQATLELLHVPLEIDRGDGLRDEGLSSLRLQLAWHPPGPE